MLWLQRHRVLSSPCFYNIHDFASYVSIQQLEKQGKQNINEFNIGFLKY